MSTALDKAREFLEASVYASREAQPPAEDEAPCGLGEGPALPVQFNARQRELLSFLAAAADDARLSVVADVSHRWIRLQDGLDRKRNHFLKAFRNEHGFARSAYSPEVLEQYQAGLDAINQENDERLDDAARQVLSALGLSPSQV
jgi:hypothetical protein